MQEGVKAELPGKLEDTSSSDEEPGGSVLDYRQYYPTLLPFVPPDLETLNAAEPGEGQPGAAAADEVRLSVSDPGWAVHGIILPGCSTPCRHVGIGPENAVPYNSAAPPHMSTGQWSK